MNVFIPVVSGFVRFSGGLRKTVNMYGKLGVALSFGGGKTGFAVNFYGENWKSVSV